MKVLLRNDVTGVGRRGDIVDVAGGFARNYLFPASLAIEAGDGLTGQAAAMRRSRDLREARDREAAETKARVLAGTTVQVSARAGASGRLFGSVGVDQVVQAVRTQKGGEIDRSNVRLDEPLKEIGTFEVSVRLFTDVATSVMVEVVAAD